MLFAQSTTALSLLWLERFKSQPERGETGKMGWTRTLCPGGGIGRRAGFRYLWPQGRGSSSLL